MTHTNRFDGKSEIYAKARPKYAAELFEYLKNVLNIPAGRVFADIGSETGIFLWIYRKRVSGTWDFDNAIWHLTDDFTLILHYFT